MIKLLYVPSGICIQWVSSREEFTATGLEYTVDYNKSHWKQAWNEPPSDLIAHFCVHDHEEDTKKALGIPYGIELNPSEFEILEEAD